MAVWRPISPVDVAPAKPVGELLPAAAQGQRLVLLRSTAPLALDDSTRYLRLKVRARRIECSSLRKDLHHAAARVRPVDGRALRSPQHFDSLDAARIEHLNEGERVHFNPVDVGLDVTLTKTARSSDVNVRVAVRTVVPGNRSGHISAEDLVHALVAPLLNLVRGDHA